MIQRTAENTPLALVSEPTAQQVFDAVVAHAAQMPRRCYEQGGCQYRSNDKSNACFVGGLLTDGEAFGLDDRPSTAEQLTERGKMPTRLIEHTYLLENLQKIHDLYQETKEWPNRLKGVAERFGLDGSSVDQNFPADFNIPSR